MAVVLTCVVVSVALWVLLCVSVCVLAGVMKLSCVLYPISGCQRVFTMFSLLVALCILSLGMSVVRPKHLVSWYLPAMGNAVVASRRAWPCSYYAWLSRHTDGSLRLLSHFSGTVVCLVRSAGLGGELCGFCSCPMFSLVGGGVCVWEVGELCELKRVGGVL